MPAHAENLNQSQPRGSTKRPYRSSPHKHMSREEFLLRHRDSFIFYIDDEALQRVVISIQKLDKKSNDYKILYKVGQNLKNDQIASDLGVACNYLSDQLSEICEFIRIPKINFAGPRRTGIYRRIVIQKAFLLMGEMQ